MRRPRVFLRDFDAGTTLDTFFISAVLAVLIVRFALSLTGYPQFGGARLHIAHVLWGGLLMDIAILLLLSFLTRPAHRVAAVVGGVGFGLFIDEVGKFLTRDTNYFFQPAVSIMYVTFVLIFIGIRTVRTVRPYSPTEYLLNALQEMEEIVLRDLDPEEQARARAYLNASDPENALVASLRQVIDNASLVPAPPPRVITRIRRAGRRLYVRIASRSRFTQVVVAFFVAEQVISLAFLLTALFFHNATIQEILTARFVRVFSRRLETLSVAGTGETISSFLSAALVVWGIVLMRRSRLEAFRMFERSVLVSVLLTQVFTFYRQQFFALVGLGFDVMVLITLRYMIQREEAEVRARAARRGEPAPAATP